MKLLISIPLALGLVSCCAGMLDGASPMPDTVVPDAKLVEVYADARFFEGPSWDPRRDKLYFTAIGENKSSQILCLAGPGKVHVFKQNSEGVVGTYISRDGSLLGAQSFTRRIVSYDLTTGQQKVLAENAAWHQPNDLCQTPSGDIYFTDPDFDPVRTSAVYRLSKDGVTKVISDMAMPNGIVASNDGRLLYVSDSRAKHWKVFEIKADGTLDGGRVFFDPPTPNHDSPDGMTIDEYGNLYFAGRGGVWVVAADSRSKGLIEVREFCSNVTFGGPDGRTLFLTCGKKVYSLAMRSARRPVCQMTFRDHLFISRVISSPERLSFLRRQSGC